jgi:hypothetical protein
VLIAIIYQTIYAITKPPITTIEKLRLRTLVDIVVLTREE